MRIGRDKVESKLHEIFCESGLDPFGPADVSLRILPGSRPGAAYFPRRQTSIWSLSALVSDGNTSNFVRFFDHPHIGPLMLIGRKVNSLVKMSFKRSHGAFVLPRMVGETKELGADAGQRRRFPI